MKRPPDEEARRLAATRFDRNVVVVAGAGSGKTTLLVERMLALLLGRGVRLDAVVALTFTEKAAAEMRERLATELSRCLEILDGVSDPSSLDGVAPVAERSGAQDGETRQGESPDEAGAPAGVPMSSMTATRAIAWATSEAGVARDELRRRALEALDDLDGGSMGTIHAFCADLLRRHPLEARLDPAFVVDDGSRVARVLDDEWPRFEARTLARGAAEEAAWRVVLARCDTGVVRALAAELVGEGGEDGVDVKAALGARVDAARAVLVTAEGVATNARAAEWARALDRVLAAHARGGRAASEAFAAETDLASTQPKPGKGSADPDAVTLALSEGLALAKALAQVDVAVVEAALGLARALAATVRERLAVDGLATFQGLLVGARDLLAGSAAIRGEESRRIEALLLDEIQDTDPIQYEIAFLLAEDPAHALPPGASPWAARLLPGRLFVVGDPKQSIYRFRGADIAACERAMGLMAEQGALVLELVANFRSRREVLEPVNLLCEGLIREDPPYQPAFRRLVPCREDAAAPRVEIWTVAPLERGRADARRLAESRAMAVELRTLRESGAIASYGDAAILFRAMSSVALTQRGLAEAGVPFVTQGGKGFVEREEVVHAIALLRTLVKPNDAASILAVLRSPSCGASDDEIRRFAELTSRRWSLASWRDVPGGSEGEVPRVLKALQGLEALASVVARLPADVAVREALLAERPRSGWSPNLVALHAASHGGPQRLANLEKLSSRAEDLARSEALSLPAVVERLWSEMRTGAELGESPLADEAVDAVKIMSIHQCKGLEFDVVLVPDLARTESSRRRRGLLVESRDGMLGVTLPGGLRNGASILVADEERRHEEAENARLLYVALTRARERLILVNGDPKPKSNAWVYQAVKAGWGYDATMGEAQRLAPGVVHRLVPELEVTGEPRDLAPTSELAKATIAQDAAAIRLAEHRRGRARSATGPREESEAAREAASYAAEPSESGTEADVVSMADAGVESVGATIARAVGIAVHLALEHGALDDPALLATLAARAARVAAGETGAEEAGVAREAQALLARVPGSPLAKALEGARVLARELSFTLERDGRPWQGFVDLVVERDGAVFVVDWKTDRIPEPGRHAAQLELYAEAVRRWLKLADPPRTALAYVATGEWIEQDLAGS